MAKGRACIIVGTTLDGQTYTLRYPLGATDGLARAIEHQLDVGKLPFEAAARLAVQAVRLTIAARVRSATIDKLVRLLASAAYTAGHCAGHRGAEADPDTLWPAGTGTVL